MESFSALFIAAIRGHRDKLIHLGRRHRLELHLLRLLEILLPQLRRRRLLLTIARQLLLRLLHLRWLYSLEGCHGIALLGSVACHWGGHRCRIVATHFHELSKLGTFLQVVVNE